MPYTNAGRDAIVQAIVGTLTPLFNNANSYLGVGNGNTAFATSQTDLVGASKARKAMDATFPTVAANVTTWKATFASSDANFAWEEAGVFNGSTANTMLARLVSAMGTKVSGSTWTLTYQLTTTV